MRLCWDANLKPKGPDGPLDHNGARGAIKRPQDPVVGVRVMRKEPLHQGLQVAFDSIRLFRNVGHLSTHDATPFQKSYREGPFLGLVPAFLGRPHSLDSTVPVVS